MCDTKYFLFYLYSKATIGQCPLAQAYWSFLGLDTYNSIHNINDLYCRSTLCCVISAYFPYIIQSYNSGGVAVANIILSSNLIIPSFVSISSMY